MATIILKVTSGSSRDALTSAQPVNARRRPLKLADSATSPFAAGKIRAAFHSKRPLSAESAKLMRLATVSTPRCASSCVKSG
jgi:hypothetical protein